MPNSVKAFSWDDLWLRPDQQAEKLFQQGETKVASQLFENPEWKGTAAYRSGDYENAIEQFSPSFLTESVFSVFSIMSSTSAIDCFTELLFCNSADC